MRLTYNAEVRIERPEQIEEREMAERRSDTAALRLDETAGYSASATWSRE